MKSEFYGGRDLRTLGLKVCSRCIYDESILGITFDEGGVCQFCHQSDRLAAEFGTGTARGEEALARKVAEIKHESRNSPYDVVVGLSGGTDSSFLLHKAVELGLRPLAVHYDNTWNTSVATQNIGKVTRALQVDLVTHVCDNKEIDDLAKSFLLAGVPEVDGPTDIALAQVTYRTAWAHRIKYVFEGHSFITEGLSPLSTAYIDGRYIIDVQRKFGSMPLKTFPNMRFSTFVFWTAFAGISKVRPLWYLDYSKEQAKALLNEQYGWQDYGGHHLENRLTAFNHGYVYPVRFGIDSRNNSLAASARNGLIARDEALDQYATPLRIENNLVEYVCSRLNLTQDDLDALMNQPLKYYRDYRTYKKRFEFFRPFFRSLANSGRVPKSFYLKYCFPPSHE